VPPAPFFTFRLLFGLSSGFLRDETRSSPAGLASPPALAVFGPDVV
jgi:hypothetical protein